MLGGQWLAIVVEREQHIRALQIRSTKKPTACEICTSPEKKAG